MKVVYVPLRLLQKELEQEGKVNTILLSAQASGAAEATNNDVLRGIVKERVRLEDLGIKLRALDEQRSLSLETDSALINSSLAETASAAANGLRPASPTTLFLSIQQHPLRPARDSVLFSHGA